MSSSSPMTDVTPVPDDDLAALLARREHARPNKLTWVLLTLLVLAVGFVGGAVANQKLGPSSGPTAFMGPPAGFTPPGMTGAAGGTAGSTSTAAGGMTMGTVKLVDGTNVYIVTTDGATVKVKVPASATVTAQKDITLADLTNGTAVLIRGETAADGTVTATSVSSQPTTQGAN